MQPIYLFIMAIFEAIRAMFGLISPIFAEARDFKNWPVWMRVLIALVFLGVICFGLHLIGRIIDFKVLVGSVPSEFVQNFYLPILFLLLLAFSWLAYGLWQLVSADTDAAEFPDILENWEEAKARLAASGLTVGDAPIFLMLGMPAERLDPLFLATEVNGIIRTPKQGQPAIRVYAWEQAIFVVCPGASAWGQYCIALSDQSGGLGMSDGGPAVDPNKTIAPGAAFAGTDGMDEQSQAEWQSLVRESGRRELSPEEHTRLRELTELSNVAPNPVRRVQINDQERNLQTRRLRFLCKLIRNDRRPWCALNGMVVLIPWASLESDDLMRLGTGILNQELLAAREVFRQRYPTFSVVVDLESADGFDRFVDSFHVEMRKRRIGQGLPLVPTLEPEEMRRVPVQAANWIGSNVLPSWILRFLKFDPPTEQRTQLQSDVEFNRSLYKLLRLVYQRGPRLAEFLSRGVPPVGGQDEFAHTTMLGGCYLAATGNSTAKQAFVVGIFERILASQEFVSWSPEALEEERRLNRLATIGYCVAITIFLIAMAVAFFLYRTTPR